MSKDTFPPGRGNSRAGVWVREESSEQHTQRLTGHSPEQLGLWRDPCVRWRRREVAECQ